MNTQEWMLKRNCSLTPRQLGLAYLVLCLLSVTVAALCIAIGVWQVIYFTLLELSAVAVAFLIYARHATDHEHIRLSADCLLIEQFDGDEVHSIRLDPVRAKVAMPDRPQDLIRVVGRGIEVEVGRHVTAARRRQIASELQRGMASAMQLPRAA